MSEARLRTRRLVIHGVEVALDEVGEGGVPLLLLHGFTGHREDFTGVLEENADLGWLVAPDLRGHGDADHSAAEPNSYRLDQLVADTAELLDQLGAPRCDLLGHSFGGMVALRFVLAHPERVRSLLLMNTAPDCPEDISAEQLESLADLAEKEGMEGLQRLIEEKTRDSARHRAREPHIAAWAERYWDHHRKRYGAMDPRAYRALARAMCHQGPVTEHLGDIDVPTLVLVGDGDEAFLPGADALTAGIPGAQRVTIREAGHHPHQENPDAWRAAFREFFAHRLPSA